MDADVRVSRPDSLARLAQFVGESGAALVSGVPRQETRGLMEKLIVPLIHFVLLGFLPLRRMRASTDPRFAAAADKSSPSDAHAYEAVGGHAAIADRIHDAVALARTFRAHGFTHRSVRRDGHIPLPHVSNASEVWHGFAKNATKVSARRD